jgi:predicted dehydrogenase
VQRSAKKIGLAIVGAGRVGLFRGAVASRHPSVEWIGIAEKSGNRGGDVAATIGADFVTTDHRELLNRPEVTAAIIATDEHLHVDPIMAAVERGVPMLIEKPLATTLADSARVLKAIEDSKLDAVVGYTQRFRRRWLVAKEKCRTGALGDVTLVTSRAFMNRLVAIDNYKRTDDPSTISPMVISGTHALDICMWCLEEKTPVEVYARSVDKVLGPLYQGIDGTAGMINFSDGTIYHLNINWALPVTWPGAVYSLEVSREVLGPRSLRRPSRCSHGESSPGQPRATSCCSWLRGQLSAMPLDCSGPAKWFSSGLCGWRPRRVSENA